MVTTLRPCPTDTSPMRGLRAGPLTAEQQDARWALHAAWVAVCRQHRLVNEAREAMLRCERRRRQKGAKAVASLWRVRLDELHQLEAVHRQAICDAAPVAAESPSRCTLRGF